MLRVAKPRPKHINSFPLTFFETAPFRLVSLVVVDGWLRTFCAYYETVCADFAFGFGALGCNSRVQNLVLGLSICGVWSFWASSLHGPRV